VATTAAGDEPHVIRYHLDGSYTTRLVQSVQSANVAQRTRLPTAASDIVEKGLSIDKLFVFVIIMSASAGPLEHQQRVLTIGIVIALALCAVFITLGAALLAMFSVVFIPPTA
jgi:predicted tellurium resistance membrane protein TerC